MDKSDIRKIKEFPNADIVLGGFPCPGFSEAGPRLVDDKRNFLYLHFIRCLMQSKSKIFVAENVKGMMTLGKGEVFKQIVQDFAAAEIASLKKAGMEEAAEVRLKSIGDRLVPVVEQMIDCESISLKLDENTKFAYSDRVYKVVKRDFYKFYNPEFMKPEEVGIQYELKTFLKSRTKDCIRDNKFVSYIL